MGLNGPIVLHLVLNRRWGRVHSVINNPLMMHGTPGMHVRIPYTSLNVFFLNIRRCSTYERFQIPSGDPVFNAAGGRLEVAAVQYRNLLLAVESYGSE